MSDIMDDVRAAQESSAPTETAAAEPAATAADPAATPDKPVRPRDEGGRYASGKTEAAPAAKTPEQTKPAADLTKPAEQAPPAAAAPARKPPQSWRPAAREKWSTLPPEVQDESIRIDQEVRRTMEGAAQYRKTAEGFNGVVGKYAAFITGEPLQVVDNLFQTAVRLQTGSAQQKAGLVAQLVQAYGVDIHALDAALSGAEPQQAQQSPAQYRDSRLDTLLQQINQQQRQRLTAAQQQKGQQVEAFAQSHEFFEDVREYMADLIEVAERRGVEMTLEDAYARALSMHPEVSKVVAARSATPAATATPASTQRARAAASSVKSQPAPAVAQPKSGSVLDEVRAAAAHHSGR